MPRLIGADALMRQLEKKRSEPGNRRYTEGFNDALMRFRSMIHSAPTIDAEPVRHGTWETSFAYDWDGNKLYIHFHRECGFEYRNYLEDEHPYCPHCGVKMDGNT